MSLVLLLARVFLVAVFLTAGLAKLADLAGSRKALRDFGVPGVLAAPFGLLLPLGELAVAVALLPAISAWWAGVFALVLLLLFVAGIGYNLARGRTPDCHCFGQLHSAPVGWSTLVRNGLLAGIAALIVVFGRADAGLDPFSWLGSLSFLQRLELLGGVVVLAALIITLWLLFHVLQQQGRLLLRLEAVEARLLTAGLPQGAGDAALAGLSVGTAAPAFRLPDVEGETHTLHDLLTLGKPLLLLFADPSCGPCAALFPEVAGFERDYASKLTLVVISRGSINANQSKVSSLGIRWVLLQKDREVQTAYQVRGTPSLVLIQSDGTIGSRLAEGAEGIRSLVASSVGSPAQRMLPMAQASRNGHAHPRPPEGIRVGEAAPQFSLPDLSGNLVKLSDFEGQPLLLLFWRPGCGFCQKMLASLREWEERPPEGAPRLLVVSSEGVESNRAMGLRSPVVLDQEGMTVGSLFGATGTPMAVLIDAEGNVASEVMAGAPAVMTLAGAPHAQLGTH